MNDSMSHDDADYGDSGENGESGFTPFLGRHVGLPVGKASASAATPLAAMAAVSAWRAISR